jgi:hypothetical protein
LLTDVLVNSFRAEGSCPHRQGGHGAKAGGWFVLDATEGMGLRAVEKVRFVRGKARKSRWCAVKHRVIEWVSRSPSRGSSK